MSGYHENYKPRGGGRGNYQGKNYDPNYRTNSHRDDRSASFSTDTRTDAARAYNSTYNQRDRYERDGRGSDRPPYPDTRERWSGNNSPADGRDTRRPDLFDMSRVRDRSRPGSPLATPALTSAGGFPNSAGGHTPTSARPSSGSGEKLVDEIRNMMRTVGSNLLLEKERDAAKRNYENSLKIYKETVRMKEDFPSTEYLARQDRDEAQATLDRLDHELKQAEASFSAKSIARYLEELVPAAAASRPSRAVEDELAMAIKQMDSMNAQIKNLVAELNDARSEIKKVDGIARNAMGQAQKQINRVDTIEQRQLNLMTYTSKIPEIEKKVNDFVATPAPSTTDSPQTELILKRVVALENQISNTMTNMKGFEGKLAVLQSNSPRQSSRAATPNNPDLSNRVIKLEEGQQAQAKLIGIINEKVGATETTLQELKTVQARVDQDLIQLNENIESLDEDISRVDQKVNMVNSAASGTPAGTQSQAANPDAMDVDHNPLTQSISRRGSPKLSEKAEEVRKELKVSPAVFEALGEIPAKLTSLLTMKEYLVEAQGDMLDQLQSDFATQLKELRDEIFPKIAALDSKEQDLENKHKQLQTEHESLCKQTTALAVLPQPSAPSAPSPKEPEKPTPVASGLQLAALSDLSKKIDEVDNKYGIFYRGLDTRMQNTHTDALANQILGSLSAAYPNLANCDEAIRLFNEGRQALEKQVQDMKRTSDKVREVVNAQGFEVRAGKQARVEMVNFEREVREKMEEIRRKVESAGTGGFGADQVQVAELRKKLEEMGGKIEGYQVIEKYVITLREEVNATKAKVEEIRTAIGSIKQDSNDKLRAFDIQLQEFREKISFEDGDNVKEKIQIVTEYAKDVADEVDTLKRKFRGEKRAGDKRTASEATSPNDSDTPMAYGHEKSQKKKKQKDGRKKARKEGTFVPDDDDEDPYE